MVSHHEVFVAASCPLADCLEVIHDSAHISAGNALKENTILYFIFVDACGVRGGGGGGGVSSTPMKDFGHKNAIKHEI